LDKRIRILVAEQDTSFIKMMEDSLKTSGSLYYIEKVSSGEQCLKMLQREKFDILLLDHSLPDGEGLNWLRRFHELGIGIPTIFVTAQGNPRLAIEAMKEGVFDYINRSAECAKAFPFVVNRAIEGYGLMVEKVRLQKELIETKNFLESIVEKAGDAISVVDLEGKVLYWNEGAAHIYGYQKEEVLGKKLLDFLYSRDATLRGEEERLMEGLMAQVKAGKVVPNVERIECRGFYHIGHGLFSWERKI
jgi:two-component system cell cycle sensor histidine kinase/response regulator CckA